jgi:exopolysaccharide biosynthesis polyprenyl glycosylphosphotransferase
VNNVIGNVRPIHVGQKPRQFDGEQAAKKRGFALRLRLLLAIRIAERAADVLTIASVAAFFLYLANAAFSLHAPLLLSQFQGLTWSTQLACFTGSVVVCLLAVESCGAYRLSGSLLHIRETACLLRAVFLPASAATIALFLLGRWALASILMLTAGVLVSAMLLQKYIFRLGIVHLRKALSLQHRVLIYGQPRSIRTLEAALRRSPKFGMLAVFTIHSSDSAAPDRDAAGPEMPMLSSGLLKLHEVDTILVAHPHPDATTVQRLTELAAGPSIPILFMAGVPGAEHDEVEYLDLDGRQLYGLDAPQQLHFHDWASRLLDIITSIALLAVFAIPMLISAMLIAITSQGPILFRQTRVGRYGNSFTIYKFRTMHTHSCGDSASPITSADPRVTRVGRFLRKASLDELPQLFNVLRGDMAMVGPRPEMPFIVADYKDVHRRRLSIKPGLTGLWQISEHRATPIHENIEYDLYYLRHRSLSLDLAVLLHTVLFAARGI